MRNGIMKNIVKRLLSIILFVVLILGTIPVEIYSYADQTDQYDTVPIDLSGSEGDVVKAERCTVNAYDDNSGNYKEYTFYIVKVPYNTKTIKFYDNEHGAYFTPDPDNNMFKPIGNKDDGWWTIETADVYNGDTTDWSGNSWLFALEQADCYCKEATYYELFYEPQASYHFFIQVGGESNPLDVLAAPLESEDQDWFDWVGSGSTLYDDYGFGEIILLLGAGKRRAIFEDTPQKIWYTTDNTNPVTSETAIEYTEGEVLKIKKECVIKAATKVSDDVWGPVCSFPCEIYCSAPDFTPTEGSFYAPFDVSIESSTEGAHIYYTLDGSEPVYENGEVSQDAIEYDGSVHIDEDTVVKAVAISEEGTMSAVTTSAYHLSTGIKIDIDGADQGVWAKEYSEHAFKTDAARLIVTPYGHSKCRVIVSAEESAALKLGDKEMTRETEGEHAGKYVLNLDVLENSNETEIGFENTIVVTNGSLNDTYTIYCVASIFDDAPDEVVDYFVPASQYTNGSWYGGMPAKSLICKSGFRYGVTLGNFGGYLTWYYKDGIKNDQKNPYGVDFIVYGNSFDGSNEAAEPGNILISKDGTKWYTLAGSLHYEDSAIWNQKVTYTPAEDGGWHYQCANYKFEGVINEEDTSRFAFPQAFHYPLHTNQDDFTSFTTIGTMLIPAEGVNEFGNVRPPYPAFGYADVGYGTGTEDRNWNFNNESSNPYGGLIRAEEYSDRLTTDRQGDPCDITWAVDEDGKPAHLDEIHYIKVQTATFIDNGAIGEKSTEVNGMCIAKPADSAVGTTAAPASIKIDGTNMDLKPGEMVNANVSGVFDVAVDAPDDANVYINSLRSHTAFMDKAPHGIVRVIVQEGEKEPLIYYFKINQDADSKTVTKVTLDAGKGLLQDKEKVDCYFDEDTFEHAGKDGAIALPEAAPAKDTQGFVFWQDADGNPYDAYDASLLGEAELTLQAKYVKKDDAEAVKAVRKLINALPEAADVTADDIEAILEAGEAYDALTDDQKALVGDKLLQKLTDDKNACVTVVEKMIDALPAADIVSLEDEEKITAAGKAYEALSDEAKAGISNYTKLLEAKVALGDKKLEKAEQDAAKALEEAKKTADEEKAAAVSDALAKAAEAAKTAQDDAVKDALDEAAKAAEAAKNTAVSEAVKNAEAAIEKANAEKKAAEDANAELQKELDKVNADKAASDSKASEAEKKAAAAEEKAAAAEKKAAAAETANTAANDELTALKLKVKGVKVKSKKRKFTVKWRKNAKADGYRVQYKLHDGKKFKTLKTLKGAGKVKAVSKKLKKGKKYEFRVAAYKNVNGKKVYGKWTEVKIVKCK